MENERKKLTTKEKDTLIATIIVIAIIIALIFVFRSCIGCLSDSKDKTVEAEQGMGLDEWYDNNKERIEKDHAKFISDSTNLVNWIHIKVGKELMKGCEVYIEEFNKSTCYVGFKLPQKESEQADECGIHVCTKVVEILSEQGFDLSNKEIVVAVYSPRRGASGKEAVTLWGNARYVNKKDYVEWEWAYDE